ncbi:hypothetical protein JLDANKMP_01269 [Stenotrophomonas sp. PE591]|nr:hypothetical protein [Stenotrophomonas sp. PE591]
MRVGRTVGAMDGAIEPPGMGLRRVLPTHTAPPSHGIPPLPLLLPLQVQGAALQSPPFPIPRRMGIQSARTGIVPE